MLIFLQKGGEFDAQEERGFDQWEIQITQNRQIRELLLREAEPGKGEKDQVTL